MIRSRNVDMIKGPILKSVLIYAIPLIISGILQIFFNAVDLAVVGNFAGEKAIPATAAVGTTGAFISLIVNAVMGLSGGVDVVLSRSIGAKDIEKSSRIVHTAIMTAVIGGTAVGIIGIILSPYAMRMINCPSESYDMAISYLSIYFAACPGIFVYNFGASVLRSKGDTRRPLNILAVAGIFNVLMNLFFVIVFDMAASGVALATALSQYLAAFLVVRCLIMRDDEVKLFINKLRIHKGELLGMVKYGLPGGATNTIYCLANIQIQSAINAFGASAVSGNSAAGSLEGFIMATATAMNATALAFIGQNIGANNKARIKKIMTVCILTTLCISLFIGFGMYFARDTLCGLYLPKDPVDTEAIRVAGIKATIMFTMYFVLSLSNMFSAISQAFGYSLYTSMISIFGVFFFRTIWLNTVYARYKTIESVFMCWPVSWIIMIVLNCTVMLIAYTKYMKKGYIK